MFLRLDLKTNDMERRVSFQDEPGTKPPTIGRFGFSEGTVDFRRKISKKILFQALKAIEGEAKSRLHLLNPVSAVSQNSNRLPEFDSGLVFFAQAIKSGKPVSGLALA
jgi:hypothetical protein